MSSPAPPSTPLEFLSGGPAAALHDVLIVGGGLVGASLAIALDRSGLDVALVEAAPPSALPAVFDQRNLSLAEASVNALESLGVMSRLRAPTGAIRRIHISRSGDFGRVRLDASEHGRERFGQVVVARDFGEALEATLASLPRLRRYRPARFLGFEDAGDACRIARLATDDGESRLAVRLVVAADGTASAVRDALGIPATRHDYGQTLFVARVRGERAPDGTAWERLTDHGPTAVLPRGDGHYGVIHGVARDEADAVAALDDAAFLERLQRAFGWRAGRFVAAGPRSAYSMQRVLAERTVAPRAVLVGNAAQTLHPIGAQGFNLGLRDALVLVECIEAAQAAGDDIGGAGTLSAWAARRREDRERTLAFSDGLARATANPSPLLAAMRGLGLLALDHDAALRARVVGGAMGYRGDVPRLCRGEAA
ncbi:MAG: 2-octaprenyl-6-methoxyphenyl hydroxylase [Xanthomonadaceae bacterium]|nr:2-octaprenyl-6-methoxyphenyl hydroxylase [Xanthomonadaceae bacterium]